MVFIVIWLLALACAMMRNPPFREVFWSKVPLYYRINSEKRMTLFLVGILEMLIVTTWTRYVTRTKVLASGSVTIINVLVWYYVLQIIVNDINNFWLVLLYALGCSLGTVIGTYYFSSKEEKVGEQKRFSAPHNSIS